MPYIGNDPQVGRYAKFDDISSSFNGSTTSFTLQVNGEDYSLGTEQNLIISVGGILQEPQNAYVISGSSITFTEAPSANSNFFGIALGDVLNIGEPSDGTVTQTKLADGSVTYNKLNANTSHTDRNVTYSVGQRGNIYDLGIISSNTTLNFDQSNFFKLEANGNFTFSNPTITSDQVGQSGLIIVNVSATGGSTVLFDTYFKFEDGTTQSVSSTANFTDRIEYLVANTTCIHTQVFNNLS